MNYFFVYYGIPYLAFLITFAANIFVNRNYHEYSRVAIRKNFTGNQVARHILDKYKLHDVLVVETSGNLTDHYDPRNKVVRLSSNIYHGSTIAAVAVACHECGHAIQDKENYFFMRIRSSLVPVVNFSTYVGYIAIVIGLLLSSGNLIWLGIALEMLIVLFQLVTLPVEINASKRGLNEVMKESFLDNDELRDGRIMLISAALTYVASVFNALLQVGRLIMITSGRRDD